MMIEAQQRKVALYAEDVARIEPQTRQGICLEVGGRKIAGPDAVGEALRGLVKATKDELRAGGREIEQLVGRFGGNALGVQATRGEEVPSLYLSGAYSPRRSDRPNWPAPPSSCARLSWLRSKARGSRPRPSWPTTPS